MGSGELRKAHCEAMLISIYPIKMLLMLREQLEGKNNTAAVLCSSFPVDDNKFDWIASKPILNFDDTTDANAERVFTLETALQIREFVDGLEASAALYICCDSGESRSSAIAAATYRYLKRDEMIVWKDPKYHPNGLVYYLMCQAYDLPVSRLQVARHKQINQRAFRDAVKASGK